jgi:hypothetical protein
MINAYSSSPHIVAYGNTSLPYVGSSPNPVHGMVRVNSSRVEVFDGNSWIELSNQIHIGMNSESERAIDWAIKRMEEERAWTELAETNSAVKIALDNLEQARQQLKVTAQLAREYDTETTS